MQIPRTRGAVSGLLLIVLGVWGAVIPFVGPYFGLVIGSDQTWDWTWGRFWLSILPGAAAFFGGLLLLTSAHRARAAIGAWLAIAGGVWFVVGPTLSMLWNDGVSATGAAAGDTGRRVLELLTMYLGLGVLIATLGACAAGRRSVAPADPVPRPPQPGRELAVLDVVGVGAHRRRVRRGLVQRVAADPQHHPALVDLGDLVGVGEPVAAQQRAGVDDQPVEDVDAGIGEDVVDDPDRLPGRVVDRRAALESEIRGGRSEIVHAASIGGP